MQASAPHQGRFILFIIQKNQLGFHLFPFQGAYYKKSASRIIRP